MLGGVYLAWSPSDYQIFPEVVADTFLSYRFAAIGSAAVTIAVAHFSESTFAKLSAISAWFLGLGWASAAMVPHTDPGIAFTHMIPVFILQWASSSLVVWRWTWGLANSVLLLFIAEICIWNVPLTEYDSFALHAYLISGIIMNVVLAKIKFSMAKREFDALNESRRNENRLQSEVLRSEALLAEVQGMRAERTNWLENLARFLRHELKNQMTAVETSVDLAHGITATGSQSSSGLHRLHVDAPRYLMRAKKSLNHMRKLVETATEATSLETALSSEEKCTLNLSRIVTDRATSFQQTHSNVRFAITSEHELMVHGNEQRLGQLLDKLLANAVEHTPDNHKIRITLTTDSAPTHRIRLAIENEGPPLPDDKESIFNAFVSTENTADNLGLGLYVVKVIANNHDAVVRAYDSTDGAGFEVVFIGMDSQ